MYDLIIVGAGPAGMTAAVYAARKKLNTLLTSKDLGGQVLWTVGIENYMGYQFISGPELMAKFTEQLKQFPVDQAIGKEVKGLARAKGGFEVGLDGDQRHQGKCIIVAAGKRPAQLGVPGEDRLWGRGVSYCATCDGPVFAGMKVAIVGGGNSALEAVDDMVKTAEHVYLISSTGLTGDDVLVDRCEQASNVTEYINHTVLEIHGDKMVEGITIHSVDTGEQQTLDVAGVFIEVGLVPNSEFARGLLRMNDRGEIEANCACETDVPGIFASGDVTNVPEKQIVVAAGEGAKAALQANRYLHRLRKD